MTRTRTSVLGATFFLLAGALALTLVLLTGRSSGANQVKLRLGAGVAGAASKENAAGEGPVGSYEAYLSAARTYPAAGIPPAVVARAKATFGRIAKRDAFMAKHGRRFLSDDGKWEQSGRRPYARPARRDRLLRERRTTRRAGSRRWWPTRAARPRLPRLGRRSGGGVWRTDNARPGDPNWKQMSPDELDQNSVGSLTLDPTDKTDNTLYLGTGEGNRCSSGCEAGVGIYKSTNGGDNWTKLDDTCVDNATYTCVTPGKDAFLGRGINAIVIDPTQREAHLRRLGPGRSRPLARDRQRRHEPRIEPGANEPGLYESTDGGKTFTEVWNGNDSRPPFGVTDVGLDPLNPDVVYASAFDAGVWRRTLALRRLDVSRSSAFRQVFAPQFTGVRGIDRTMFALTVKNGAHAHLPDRRHARTAADRRRARRRTSGAPTTPTSRPRRCSRRRPRVRRSRPGTATRSRPPTPAGSG